MKMQRSQRGASFASVVLIIALIILVLVTVGKLFPIYKNHYGLLDMIENIEVPKNIESVKERSFSSSAKTTMAKQLRLNGVYDFDLSAVEFKKRKGYIEAQVRYQDEIKLSGSWTLVIHFDETVEIYPE